jgi:large subunit ribosomal protein L20
MSLRNDVKNLNLARIRWINSRLSTMAGEQVVQSLNFAYIGRRLKKRNFRRIWI